MKIRDIYLTEHFRVGEFGCKCGECKQEDLNNGKAIDRSLVYMLETLRVKLDYPIIITSGIRCSVHNRAIGGVVNSLHLLGRAVDITIKFPDGLLILWQEASKLSPNGLGYYPDENFIHIDTGNRFARWTRKDGKYIYWLK